MADVQFVLNQLQAAAPADARRFEAEIREAIEGANTRGGEWFRCWILGPRHPEGLDERVSVQLDVGGWATSFAIARAVPTGEVRRAVARAMLDRKGNPGARTT